MTSIGEIHIGIEAGSDGESILGFHHGGSCSYCAKNVTAMHMMVIDLEVFFEQCSLVKTMYAKQALACRV